MTRALGWIVGCCAVLLAIAPASAGAQEATRSPHGDLAEPCASCHGSSGWKPARISRAFDHARKGFPLTGAHASTACRSCHAALDFKGASRNCVGCHTDVHRGELGADCARCHTARTFLDRSVMVQAHQATRFPLNGSHLAADCESCHTPAAQGRLTFVNRSTECVQCHLDSYQSAKSPDHVGGGFPTDCNQCHSTSTWPGARFNHATSRFPLTGAHRAVQCQQCHGDGVYRGKNSACVSCHQADYDRTADPNHRTAQFPTECASCHTTTSWGGAVFDHSATAFPLTGAHRAVACQECHGDGVYHGKSTACVSCHQADYDRTTDPNHRSAQFPTDCTGCHTTTNWDGAGFDHSTTAFPLTGAHTAATCQQCHGDGLYQGKSTVCIACHQADYDGTTDPNHRTAQFPTDCASCHTTSGWPGATFDHDARSFPIYSGAHRGEWTTCSTCHTNSANYQVFTCLTCHEHNQSSMDSKHSGRSGYSYNSQACYSCHPRGNGD